MTPKQLFEQAAGVSAAQLTVLVASLLMLSLLTWGGWVALSQLALFQQRQVSLFDVLVSVLRAVVMMLLLSYLIR
jgi:integrating conjugative element protein (TIGR03758 family)